ncbi:MAG TPA: DNA recombination protein RmuC [Rhodospirillaceae bacterium]|uniref:DNA recombination protein RmuC n=1 Tax=Hyphomonas sp. UBA3201 TaxID=1946623 RepID=UPI000C69C344|nr:DNA recombination protein RmuC [Magnetovibrio sp.]HBT41415.1 DNA recombination protein RmuC [Rhodospirillaceae bacterium]HCS71018.1 DNA recombination protein RmuC [Rhodospirillaceae bacterium]|tara:strand:+ start:266 stop:1642 length:1377 start_codon:yes stop_codon:yes gene_type:complete
MDVTFLDNTGVVLGIFFTLGVIIVLQVIQFARSRTPDASSQEELTSRHEELKTKFQILETLNEKLERSMQSQIGQFGDSIAKRMIELGQMQKTQFDGFSDRLKESQEASRKNITALGEGIQKQQEKLESRVDLHFKTILESNEKKLEEMRKTVDEKLQGTLEKRLGESFKQVSERLEQVHRGLGEMQNLANGVGDLRRVLTNVRTRGSWGEIQLGRLLEDIFTTDQYDTHVAVKPQSNERVEFAIKLPGKNDDNVSVYLPIDAKFPKEDYERLIEASEIADVEAVAAATKALENQIKKAAKDIRDKYISPPHTTDFAVMYLPTEGLYAEVNRRPGLVETIQRDFRVVISGPSNCSAFLNSLQMGFRTLAIEKRSSEVWEVLGAVKTEFGKFGTVLGQVKKKLHEASSKMDDVDRRTRVLGRKLRTVEELPQAESTSLLGLVDEDEIEEDDDENSYTEI